MDNTDILGNYSQKETIEGNTALEGKDERNDTDESEVDYKQSEIEKISSQTGEYLVCQGATCLCDQGETIHVKLSVISNNKIFLNDSLALATINDNVLNGTFNKCKLNPSSGKPCIYQPKNKWTWKEGIQDYFSEVNGIKFLTDNAILHCPMFPGIIKISYNGQEIDVPESDKEELDSSIDSSIICLMDNNIEPSEDMKNKTPNITSLAVTINGKIIKSTVKNQGQANKDVKITKINLRQNKEYEFTAIDDKSAGYNYWYIRNKDKELDNNLVIPFNTDNGLFYTQTGSIAKFTFKEVSTLYIEAFGFLEKKGKIEKKAINNNCAFEIDVVDKNSITGIKLTPTELKKDNETTFTLEKKKLYIIELQTLLPLEDEDLEDLSIEVHDTSIRFTPPGTETLPLFKGKEAIRFSLNTSDNGNYILQIKHGDKIVKNYNFNILENEVKQIRIINPKVGSEHWVRPGTRVTFEAILSDSKDKNKRIQWQINNSVLANSEKITLNHPFYNIGDYSIKASYRGMFGFTSNTANCSIRVRANKINKIVASKNTQSVCVGSDIIFSVDTPYLDLIDKEYIQWILVKEKIDLSNQLKPMVYSIPPTNIAGLPTSNLIKLGGVLNKKKDLNIIFNQLGTFNLIASIGGDKSFNTPTIIKVIKSHIEAWNFCDKNGNLLTKLGWGQKFYFRIKIRGCEGRSFRITFWYDNRSKNTQKRFYKIDSGLDNHDFILKEAGIGQWSISGQKIWISLKDLVEKYGSSSKKDYARIMFTISNINTLFDNNKNYSDKHPLFGYIFPNVVDNTTAVIPNNTEYKSLFLDSNKNKLTDIISYSDIAYMSLNRIKSPKDTNVQNLELRLWENREGSDLLQQRLLITSWNEEGYIVPHLVNMKRIIETKQDKQSKTTPRFFYMQLCEMQNNKNDVKKVIYTYPEGYKTGKDNDFEIIELKQDNKTSQDISNNNVLVSSAKRIHDFAELAKSIPLKREKFDEEKEKEKVAKDGNKVALDYNSAILDRNKNYFLQLKIADDPSQQKSRYMNTGKQVGMASGGTKSDCGGKYCITRENYKSYNFGTAENVGKLIQEINIRLAGFGGNVPTKDFDKRTEDTIKQFQRDYMGIAPTGKICGGLLNAIDDFCKKYPVKEDLVKCPCGNCKGFGNLKYSEQKGKSNILEKSRKYEYPGIHRSIIAATRAIIFYIAKDSKSKYSFDKIYSGYRCHNRNTQTGRASTNHMGKALDLHFKYNSITISGKSESSLKHMNTIKEEYILHKMNANPTFATANINKFALEPTGIASDHAWSWIHIDVRGYEVKYLDDAFFLKSAEEWNNSTLFLFAKQMSLANLCSCSEIKKAESVKDNIICTTCKFPKNDRKLFYEEFGKSAINAVGNHQKSNKFKGLYIIAQRRAENSFRMEVPNNNPMNIKGKGDLGRSDLYTHEYINGKRVNMYDGFANFSTVEKGFEGYIDLLTRNYSDAYNSLFNDSKTIDDFLNGLIDTGRLGAYATSPNYKSEIKGLFNTTVKDYKEWYNCKLSCKNYINDKTVIEHELELLNKLK